jgi:hypothetical protein
LKEPPVFAALRLLDERTRGCILILRFQKC